MVERMDSLPTPHDPAGREGLAALLARPRGAVVALDFDGTLAPIVPDPEQARAHPGAVPALAAPRPRVAAVAVITGRPAGVAVRLRRLRGRARAGPPRRPRPLRRRTLGRRHRHGQRPRPAPRRRRRPRRTARVPRPDRRLAGTWIEEKGRAVAVHTRRAADPQAAFEALREPLAELADPPRADRRTRPHGPGVAPARHGQGRRPGRSTSARSAPTSVLYAGDDLGDLPAFAAVEKLRSRRRPGPAGVQRQRTEAVTELAERADLVVDGPAGVVRLLDALGGRRRRFGMRAGVVGGGVAARVVGLLLARSGQLRRRTCGPAGGVGGSAEHGLAGALAAAGATGPVLRRAVGRSPVGRGEGTRVR